MTDISVAVEGTGDASVVAARVDDWRRRFAPSGTTTRETFWVTTVDGKSRSRKPSEAAWSESLAALAEGRISALEWEPSRGEAQFPLDVALRAPSGRVAFNGVLATGSGHVEEEQAAVLEWTTQTVGALAAGVGWGDSVSEMLGRFGRASVDVRETGVEVRDDGLHGFADAWWALWIGGPPLEKLGGARTVVSGWPGALAEEQAGPAQTVVLAMIAERPDLVDRSTYLQVFDFLRPVLVDGLEPRADTADLEESFRLLERGGLPDEWLAHLRPRDSSGPTDEQLRDAPMPPADPELDATFKAEENDERGELVGPLIVSHPQRGVLWEAPEWMREAEARALAAARRWRYWRDA